MGDIRMRRGGIVFIAALAAYSLSAVSSQPWNEHAIQAIALWHGQTFVDWAANGIHEKILYRGHYFILHPPGGALVMMPFVLFGISQTTVSTLMAATSVALADRLTNSLWLTAFFGFGTVLFYEATLGASWGFLLVLSTIPTLLALIEVFGRGRGGAVGVYGGIAALARYDLVLVWPIYIALLAVKGKRVVTLIPGFVLALAVYAWYAHARFGTWNDIAISEWAKVDAFCIRQGHGMFSAHYLPFNLYTALFLPPNFDQKWLIRPQFMGQAIIFTSPAFLYALKAKFTEIETWLLWAAVALGMGAALTVYANGFAQFGARYWIQVYPFLLALMRKVELDQLGYILIALSIVLCATGTLEVRYLGF